MTDQPLASRPEDVSTLFVERSNAGDADGAAALYAEDAVMAFPPGRLTEGREAVRALWAEVLEQSPHFEPEPPLVSLERGDVALTATRAKDGTGVRVQVLRRDADGGWRRVIDVPELS